MTTTKPKPLASISSPQPQTIELLEFDQTNNLIATYLKTSQQIDNLTNDYLKSSSIDERGERIDVTVQKKRMVHGYGKSLIGAFLPGGYPDSVSEDYLEYQIYDSLQAFSSSIAGMLSSRAVLEGIGVGSTHTTPTNALLLTILQESLGRLATILFASRLGPSLEAECKFYRLAADVFNDMAMLLDCLSPALPTMQRVLLLSGSGILRALCGIAAGSSKASLSVHFARKGNVADLAAKDSSQETIISLMGMLAGSIVITYITTQTSTWLTLLALLSIHLYTNYRAVRAVRLNTLNQQRANILFSHLTSDIASSPNSPLEVPPTTNIHTPLLTKINPLNPHQVSQHERIFTFHDNVLRSKTGHIISNCKLGVRLSSILSILPKTSHHTISGSYDAPSSPFSHLLDIFKDLPYLLYYSESNNTVFIAVKKCSQRVYLQAWFHALLLMQYLKSEELRQRVGSEEGDQNEKEKIMAGSQEAEAEKEEEKSWKALHATARDVTREWGNIEKHLAEEGWDLDIDAMVPVAGKVRFRVRRDDENILDEEEKEKDSQGD